MKRWETEQAAEVEKCMKFTQETCGCALAHGDKTCSTLFPLGYYMDYRAQMFFLSREQLDMVYVPLQKKKGHYKFFKALAQLLICRESSMLCIHSLLAHYTVKNMKSILSINPAITENAVCMIRIKL